MNCSRCSLRSKLGLALNPTFFPFITSLSVTTILTSIDLILFVFSSGAVSLRMDTVGVLCSAESSRVSLQGVSLSVVKTITENMETCCPASQTPNPVLKLTAIAFCYHITTCTLEVIRS